MDPPDVRVGTFVILFMDKVTNAENYQEMSFSILETLILARIS